MAFRNKSASTHQFALVPKARVPRSSFLNSSIKKFPLNANDIVPFVCEEVLPGDTFSLRANLFCRLSTPLFPFFDNLYLDTFYFFVPNRLVWTNFVKMMGEQANPGDSISFVVPSMLSTAGGYAVGSIYDYFGLPTVGQITGGLTFPHSVLPLRGYTRIWNDWFRDENLQNSQTVFTADSGDAPGTYGIFKRGKRPDYFTGCLPFLQKGPAVTIPMGTSAPVVSDGTLISFHNAAHTRIAQLVQTTGVNTPTWSNSTAAATGSVDYGPDGTTTTGLRANLTSATASTINAFRLSYAMQELLEQDARGGTRYTEITESQFGVHNPDGRLQRTEYLGGGSTRVAINPIAQTSGTGLTGGTTPVATLAAIGSVLSGGGFRQSFTEHGYVIGLCSVRADLTYQQGLRRHWSRSTRLDFYTPLLAHLGEQAVLNKEIYCVGGAPGTQDDQVFGYQERWAEYKYGVGQIVGLMRSTSAGTLDAWHLSQKFTALPTLNSTFIEENVPIARVVAVPAAPAFLCDGLVEIVMARCMPTYSVPGLGGRF